MGLNVRTRTVRRDMVFFFICFRVAAGLSVANSLFVVPFLVKVAVAVGLVVAYVVHVVCTVITGEGLEEVPDDLTFWPEPVSGRRRPGPS